MKEMTEEEKEEKGAKSSREVKCQFLKSRLESVNSTNLRGGEAVGGMGVSLRSTQLTRINI